MNPVLKFIALIVGFLCLSWVLTVAFEQFSPGATGMALGMLLGVMAGFPAMLLATRRRDDGYIQPRQQPPAQIVEQTHNHFHYHAAPGEQMRLPRVAQKQIEIRS